MIQHVNRPTSEIAGGTLGGPIAKAVMEAVLIPWLSRRTTPPPARRRPVRRPQPASEHHGHEGKGHQ